MMLRPSTWLVISVLFVAYALAGAVDKWAESEATSRDPRAASHTIDLRDCSPPNVILNPFVSITIIHVARGKSIILGCTRYAATNTIASRIVTNPNP